MERREKFFVLFAMLVNFCIGSEYAITRPASHSLFLGSFSAEGLPAFWLATVPLNFLIVYLYNRYISRLGSLKMMGISSFLVCSINLLCAFVLPIYPKLIFLHYCWKDIYILLMFKQLWSVIHVTLPQSRPKALFGIIFGASTFGACLGSLIPGFFAAKLTTEKLFLFTVPIYLCLILFYFFAHRLSHPSAAKMDEQKSSMKDALALITGSRVLVAILLLTICMQVSVALIEYQFSHHLELAFPLKDLRTQYFGRLLSVVQGVSFFLQVVGSYLLFSLLGVKRSHFLIPGMLFLAALGQLAFPGFAMMAAVFILTKSIDFSLFGVMREILFSPLQPDEKFRAKAFIDIFAYRTSKSLASFFLWGLQFWVGAQIFSLVSYFSIGMFCIWIAVVLWLFMRKPATA